MAYVVGYAVLTTSYSLVLKRLVIIDVIAIAAGFLIRVVAGGRRVDVADTEWLIVCTGSLAMFLGFTKRRQEAASEAHLGLDSRPVLEHYSLPFLDQMVSMVSIGTVLSYVLYTVNSPLIGSRMLPTAGGRWSTESSGISSSCTTATTTAARRPSSARTPASWPPVSSGSPSPSSCSTPDMGVDRRAALRAWTSFRGFGPDHAGVPRSAPRHRPARRPRRRAARSLGAGAVARVGTRRRRALPGRGQSRRPGGRASSWTRSGWSPRRGASTASPRVTIHCADVTRLEEHGSYDGALAIDVIHHIDPDAHAGVATALARSVRPGGMVLVKDMDLTPRWKYRWNAFHDRVVAHEQVHCRAPDDMAGLFEAAGLKTSRVRAGRPAPQPVPAVPGPPREARRLSAPDPLQDAQRTLAHRATGGGTGRRARAGPMGQEPVVGLVHHRLVGVLRLPVELGAGLARCRTRRAAP